MKTWSEDYTTTHNALTAMTKGSVSVTALAATSTLLTLLKRVTEWVVSHDPNAPKLGRNPFELEDPSLDDHIQHSEMPGAIPHD